MPTKSERTKERLLACGKKHFVSEGYSGFNIRELAEECDVALGTLYHYFHSKEEMAIEIMNADWRKAVSSVGELVGADLPVNEKLRRVYRAIADYMHCYWFSTSGSLDFTRTFQKQSVNNIRLMYRKVQELLEHEIAAGKLELHASPEKASHILTQLFMAVGKDEEISFDDIWECLHFKRV